MDITALIISTLWGILTLTMMMSCAPYCKNLSQKDKLIVCFIFLIGSPAFALTNILHALLDTILPEGWDMDDDDFKGY